MWSLTARPTDGVENWGYLHKALTKEQCAEVIKLGESLLPDTARTFGGDDPNVRDSKVSWIAPSAQSEWLFRHMTDIVNILNHNLFKFDLEGFAEGFQFTKYEAPGGKYNLHIDKTDKQIVRKLSVVVQLSDPSEYEGGDLLIQTGDKPDVMHKEQGYLTIFPSYVLHGVTPVTKGTRYSLVSWITGPAFK